MYKERGKYIDFALRPVFLAALLLAAHLGCSEEHDNVQPSSSEETATQVTLETETAQPTEESSTIEASIEEIIQAAKEHGHGVVFFFVKEYDGSFPFLIKFTRVDIPVEQRGELDTQSFKVDGSVPRDKDGIISTVFPTSACAGEYRVDISLDDGTTYKNLPIPDLETRIPRETFSLTEDCFRPLTLDIRLLQEN